MRDHPTPRRDVTEEIGVRESEQERTRRDEHRDGYESARAASGHGLHRTLLTSRISSPRTRRFSGRS